MENTRPLKRMAAGLVAAASLLIGASPAAAGESMHQAPRVDVEVGAVVRGSGISRESLLKSVQSELRANGKLEVVATARERKYLRAIRHPSLAASADEAYACEVAKEVTANSLVKVSISGGRLHLRLLSTGKGCLVASGSSTWNAESPQQSLSEASTTLLAQLRLPTPHRQGAQPAALPETSNENLLAKAAVPPANGDCVTDPNLRPGRITITTQPFSTIYWNGRKLGETPLARATLPAGCVTLVAKNAKLRLERRVKIKVTSGQDNLYRFALE